MLHKFHLEPALDGKASLLLAQTRPVSEAEVRSVHRSALLIDTHNDVTSETVKGLDIGPRRARSELRETRRVGAGTLAGDAGDGDPIARRGNDGIRGSQVGSPVSRNWCQQ